MRVLFNVWSRAGHLNGSIGIARELQASGDEVAFCCFHDGHIVAERLREAGLECPCHYPTSETPSPPAGHHRYLEISRRLQLRDWRQKYLERLLIHSAVPQIPWIRRQIEDFSPDVFCTEAVSYGGAIAAAQTGARWATVATSWGCAASPDEPGDFAQALRDLDPARRKLVRDHAVQVDFHWIESVSPHLNLTFADERLTPSHPSAPANTILLGRCPPTSHRPVSFPWHRLDPDRPLVYLSSGTEFRFEPTAIEDLIALSLELGAQIVVTSSQEEDVTREFVTRVHYAPQPELLAKASVFVSAGGCNSLLDSVAAGVPLLLLPVGHDQPFNAALAARAGIARVLDVWEWNRAKAGAALQQLLAAPVLERIAARAAQNQILAGRAVSAGAMELRQLASPAISHPKEMNGRNSG